MKIASLVLSLIVAGASAASTLTLGKQCQLKLPVTEIDLSEHIVHFQSVDAEGEIGFSASWESDQRGGKPNDSNSASELVDVAVAESDGAKFRLRYLGLNPAIVDLRVEMPSGKLGVTARRVKASEWLSECAVIYDKLPPCVESGGAQERVWSCKG